MSFWEAVWLIVISFAFIAYLIAMFSIIADLFRDREVGGGVKALWLVCLVFFPFVTALVYVVLRGTGMAERSARDAQAVRTSREDDIRDVAGGSGPADQIARAKGLLDSGAISPDEFAALKAKALA